eukprot:8594057-Pyramimonas_sp.AAC.1
MNLARPVLTMSWATILVERSCWTPLLCAAWGPSQRAPAGGGPSLTTMKGVGRALDLLDLALLVEGPAVSAQRG